ncbi:uncharacterized protein FFMR_11677 [Fusarium fujikuroi]|nr:uncharacterized protein FFM5_13976 [Fusarium fujikuroi]SCO54177.1 uncharacterized protein FFMR_11677 [Fusarium fujikuroi]
MSKLPSCVCYQKALYRASQNSHKTIQMHQDWVQRKLCTEQGPHPPCQRTARLYQMVLQLPRMHV